MIMDWAVYIAECADGSFYTGITNDLPKRIAQHNDGKGARYTRTRTPIKVVYDEPAIDRSQASKRECEIKAMSRNQKIALISTRSDN